MKSLLCLVLSFGLFACGVDAQLKSASEGMRGVNDALADMKEDITHLDADARQSIALLTRLKAQQAMNEATTIEAKLVAAAEYFMAFEFQVWKGTRLDTPERRDELFASAIAEFFRTFGGIVAKHGHETSPISDDNEVNNLYAVATTLHYLNPNQELFLKETSAKPVSMLDLIQHTVSIHKLVKTGQAQVASLKAWEKEGLYWYENAVYFLRLRAQFLAAMVMNRLANLDANREGGKIMKSWTKAQLALFPWEVKWETLTDNPMTLDQLSQFAEGSHATSRFLALQGISNPVSSMFRKALEHMVIHTAKYAALEKALAPQPGLLHGFTERLLEMRAALTRSAS